VLDGLTPVTKKLDENRYTPRVLSRAAFGRAMSVYRKRLGDAPCNATRRDALEEDSKRPAPVHAKCAADFPGSQRRRASCDDVIHAGRGIDRPRPQNASAILHKLGSHPGCAHVRPLVGGRLRRAAANAGVSFLGPRYDAAVNERPRMIECVAFRHQPATRAVECETPVHAAAIVCGAANAAIKKTKVRRSWPPRAASSVCGVPRSGASSDPRSRICSIIWTTWSKDGRRARRARLDYSEGYKEAGVVLPQSRATARCGRIRDIFGA